MLDNARTPRKGRGRQDFRAGPANRGYRVRPSFPAYWSAPVSERLQLVPDPSRPILVAAYIADEDSAHPIPALALGARAAPCAHSQVARVCPTGAWPHGPEAP